MTRQLGRKPILTFGNSSGDYPMFEFTKNHTLREHKLLHQDLYEYLNIKKTLAVKNVLHPIFPRTRFS